MLTDETLLKPSRGDFAYDVFVVLASGLFV